MPNGSTKLKIRDAAMKLFLERGYVKTSIAAIEREAGLAPRAGAFYRHFESKQSLLLELAQERITESPAEFGFRELADYRDTRAELIAIAHTYEEASERQKPYLRLVEEVRLLDLVSTFESDANAAMFAALVEWVSQKPAAAELPCEEQSALAMSIFGSWLFYLTKQQQGINVSVLDRDVLLDVWARHWAAVLDQEASIRS